MSDAVRSYAGKKRVSQPSRGRRRGIGFPFKSLFLLLLVAIVAFGFWATRDTHSVRQLLPANQKYWAVLPDVLNSRSVGAESRVWQALPESLGGEQIAQALGAELGVPDWVLKNLVLGDCHVSGNDLRAFGDALILTKMSRIGALLERFCRFTGRIEHDPAGGLHLRSIPEAGLYYAVRGRVLGLSRSREALIMAVTLRDEDAIAPDAFASMLEEAGAEFVRGRVAFAEDDPLGDVLQYVRFSARLDETQAHVTCKSMLRPEWEARFQGLLEGASPQALPTPPDGMIGVSLNLGRSVKDAWLALGEATEWEWCSKEQWAQWEESPEGEVPTVASILTALLGPLGPGLRMSWHGTDMNEVLPLPELVGTFDTEYQSAETVLAALPSPTAEALPWESYPRYDSEAQRVHVPMMFGPSLELTAGAAGGGLLVSSSRTVGDRLLDAGKGAVTLERPGNLFVRVDPGACVDAAADAGRLVVALDCLKGYTPESFEEDAANWLQRARRIEEAAFLVAVESGELTGELSLVCRAE